MPLGVRVVTGTAGPLSLPAAWSGAAVTVLVDATARQMLAAALQAEVAAQETTSMRSFQFHPRKRQ